ncbi:MAG: FtsB family cell division protein [Mangrovibacterium sp.]
MRINKILLKKLFNKWTIPIIIFILYITFFSEHGIWANRKLKSQLHDLHKQEEYLIDKIAADKQRINELQSSQKNLEKFAREQFYMHKDNEDVFIITETE